MSETETPFDTAEGLYDEIDGLRVMLAVRERQLGAHMAAARQIVAGCRRPSSPASGDVCWWCDNAIDRHGHRPNCPVRVLAALLEERAP